MLHPKENYEIVTVENEIFSTYLNRKVHVTLYKPAHWNENLQVKTLLLNDGQDAYQLRLVETLNKFTKKNNKVQLVIIAVHANEQRIFEYGVSHIADYKNRGNKATEYEKFIIEELIPFFKKEDSQLLQKNNTFFAGFSLGGLSAMDITLNNPTIFTKVGVFSGSFWWRKKAYEDGYDDYNDRIMHVKVRNEDISPELKFWFECGTADEESDRNNNGVIDSIDDTLDLITELEKKGFKMGDQVTYLEVIDGKHDFNTWSKIFPTFLRWLCN